MQIHFFVKVTEPKNSRSLNSLSLEIEYKISLITDLVIGVKRKINQNVSIVLNSQTQYWLFRIESALGNFLSVLLFRVMWPGSFLSQCNFLATKRGHSVTCSIVFCHRIPTPGVISSTTVA